MAKLRMLVFTSPPRPRSSCFVQGVPGTTAKLFFIYLAKIHLTDSSFCARLYGDGDAVHLCYTINNSRVYHKEEPKSFEIQTEVCLSCVF